MNLIDQYKDIEIVDALEERYLAYALTTIMDDIEIKKSEGRLKKSSSYAKRFAAKEAVTKALGTGLSSGVFFKDIGVENNKYGKPSIVLTGGAKLRLKNILPKNHKANINLTITDDFPWAQAIVIIEATTE